MRLDGEMMKPEQILSKREKQGFGNRLSYPINCEIPLTKIVRSDKVYQHGV